MNSLILRETTRLLVGMMLVFSVFMLLRGHNEPGGGFIGGLIAAIAFSLYALATDAAAVRRALRIDPRTIAGVGLGIAILSGIVGVIVEGAPFLTGQWTTIADFKLGTPLPFDIGVYLVVVGAVLTIVLGIKEQQADIEDDPIEPEDTP
jgi:multicomponent Na+:H+ antiporter subunit B